MMKNQMGTMYVDDFPLVSRVIISTFSRSSEASVSVNR